MEEEGQLANSTCLVGSLDRFLEITEKQNRVNPQRRERRRSRLSSSCSSTSASVCLASSSTKRRMSLITEESAARMEKRVRHRELCARKIQALWKNYMKIIQNRREALKKDQLRVHYHILTHALRQSYQKKRLAVRNMQHWWRRENKRRQELAQFRLTQGGIWTIAQANAVKALISGYKTRKAMRDAKLHGPTKSAILLIEDALGVIDGICDDVNSDDNLANNIFSGQQGNILSRYFLIYCSSLDTNADILKKKKCDRQLYENYTKYRRILPQLPLQWAFVNNMGQQVLCNRALVSKFVVQNSEHPVFRRNKIDGQSKVSKVRREKETTSVEGISTPKCNASLRHNESVYQENPRKLTPKSLGSLIQRNKDLSQNNFSPSTPNGGSENVTNSPCSHMLSISVSPLESSPIRPKENYDFHSPRRSNRKIPSEVASSPPMHATSKVLTNNAKNTLSEAKSVPSRKDHWLQRPHLQIDVMRAEDIGAVAASRKARNLAVRKPGLKVTVYMPQLTQESVCTNPSSGTSGLRVVQTYSFVPQQDISPTHPIWNFTSYCPLKTPIDKGRNHPIDIPHALSTYWSKGKVKIEIIDSERFNEDIHLGEVNLFLSNYLLSSSNSQSLYREISGVFPIDITSTSCKSGLLKEHGGGARLTLAVYLHLPVLESSPQKGPTLEPCSNLSRELKSALANVPSGPTASSRRQKRHIMRSSIDSTSENAAPRSNFDNTPQLFHGCRASENSINKDDGGKKPACNNSDSSRRRKSLQRVGNILGFLEENLQEEAEATVASLKQKYAESQSVTGNASASGPPSNDGSEHDANANDLDLESMQMDIDGILGALNRRLNAKGRKFQQKSSDLL